MRYVPPYRSLPATTWSPGFTARRGFDGLASAAVAIVLGVWLAMTTPSSPALGWDESMHAQLPAARIALALRAGEVRLAVDAVLGCAQYPPVWPSVLGL